jgi:DNA-binding response OmpR family regulator
MKILIVEDEFETADAIADYLRINQLQVDIATHLSQAEILLDTQMPDILVLDIQMPDGNGLKWLEQNVEILSQTGVIMVSAHHFDSIRIRALELGVDVFLRKPVSGKELYLQIVNLANRIKTTEPKEPDLPNNWRLQVKKWAIITPEGTEIPLTLPEIQLLTTLAKDCFKPVSRNEIIIGLKKSPEVYDQRRLETMIRRLRQKVEGYAPDETFPLSTVRGVGYTFIAPITIEPV